MCNYVYVRVYIYIYIERERERRRASLQFLQVWHGSIRIWNFCPTEVVVIKLAKIKGEIGEVSEKRLCKSSDYVNLDSW